MIDLVNESLEALAAGLPGATGGAVYDTAGDALAGHELATDGDVGGDPVRARPADALRRAARALVARHAGRTAGRRTTCSPSDFTAPDLPYPQALDVSRSYLGALGSSRFAAMRHFRKDITEFAIDAANEPADFLRTSGATPSASRPRSSTSASRRRSTTCSTATTSSTSPTPGGCCCASSTASPPTRSTAAVDGRSSARCRSSSSGPG